MRRLLVPTLAALLAACATAPAPQTATRQATGELPPLLDRNLFFDDPQMAGAQISPDGRFVSFRKPLDGVMNIWVKGIDEPFEAARPLTADTARPVRGYFWSEDSRYILYGQDKGGNENFHVYAIDPTAPADEATGVPPSRDLTPGENVRAYIFAVPESTPNAILVGLNDRDPALHDVYRLDLDTGERQLLVRNDQGFASFRPDLEGNVRLAFRQAADGSNEVVRITDGEVGDVVLRCTFEETCFPVRFHKDGRQVYVVENIGDVDLERLSLLDLDTGALTPVESDPENEVDLSQAIFSDRTEELIGTVYVGDRQRIYPRDEALRRTLENLGREFPGATLELPSATEDESKLIVFVSSDVDPGSAWVYDVASATPTLLYRSRPDLPSEHLAPMQAIRYPARDGLSIPALLTLPKGVAPRNLPVVVLPHGGPWARDFWGYNSYAQLLANRGYAVLQPNFRASTGYGKRFLNAGNKQWGTGSMQHDISDGVKYLVDNGIADPARVGIMGGSYGGYATLAGLAFTPELYAAGVSIVGPSNLFTLLNSIPPYWGPIRKMFLLRMGDPDVDKEQLEAQSPLFHAERIEDPLLVIQGANDPRVKQAESDQIVVALRDRGHAVEYLVAPDEGHGFAGRENRIAMIAAIEKFFATHLGGRYQAEMPPDIAQKLAAITVDPATVEKPQVATALDAARTSPLPVVEPGRIAPATLEYTTSVALPGGRTMEVQGTTTITREEGDRPVLEIATTASTPMGEARDTFVVDAATLRPISRSAQQGPATVSIEYGDRAVKGAIKAGPQEIPIEVALEAPAFGEEASLQVAIAALPYTTGYRTTLRSVEAGMQQRVRYWSLTVRGEESVTVPAGTYDTYEVVLEPLDGEAGGATFWVTREDQPVIARAEYTLPPTMGGGTATSVLTARR